MAIAFHRVPDWNSTENHGADITIASLAKDGQSDLIILQIDHRTDGTNRGLYRVGHRLDPAGNITGGWEEWREIPDWGSNNNQGCGIAVADFGADGLALVIFQVQHIVPGPNRGLFRIGRGLNAQGEVTGGWTDWREIPGWVSWRSQGSAITVADLDNDGQPELILCHIDDFHTDHPRLPNKAFYRVGSKLSLNGEVDKWTDWFEVDWFSWFNQGAGVAVCDLDGNGRPEIIIFQIDNPPQENAGFYRVGWNLDETGRVQDGWGPWVKLDGWGSFEDQGGGFALAFFNSNRPKAVVFQVDNPPGLNAGLFAVTDLTLDIDTAAERGVWRLLPYYSEVLPVHAALLHTGKVLFFAGSGNNVFRFSSPNFGNEAEEIYTSVVWNASKNVLDKDTFTHPPTLRRANNSVIDLFCCGHTFLPDGRLVIAGGTAQYDKKIVNNRMADAGHGFAGIRDVLIFDPATERWTVGRPMKGGRWYPTLVLLNGGSLLVASGLDEQAQGQNDTLEINSNLESSDWQQTRDFRLPLYPHLFQLNDGRLFYTGGKMDSDGDSVPLVFDPIHATQSVLITGLTDIDKCNQCASVILPPAQAQKFMIIGGGPEDDTPTRGQATQRVSVIDFQVAQPIYQTKAPLKHERMHVNAVLLPDRTVLAVGGGVTREASVQTNVVDPQGGREVFEAEIYHPDQDSWSITAPATVARLYHSIALLLPDGRVVAAGGNPDKGSQANWLPPDPVEEMRLEIFSPPYLFKKSPRPVITSLPTEIRYGSTIMIQTSQPDRIKWINLIKPGLTTHSFDSTQRLVDLPFTRSNPDLLKTRIPTRNSAPAGWYMLFLTDLDDVPSIGSWVHLS